MALACWHDAVLSECAARPHYRLCARLLHHDDDFAFGMTCFHIAQSVCNLTQGVPSVDDRGHFALFKQLFENQQILLVWLMSRVPHLLSPHPRNHWPQE